VAEYDLAVFVLIEPDARTSLGQHRGEVRLADFERIAAQVVAVQLYQVEGVQKHPGIVVAVAKKIEGCNAVVITGDRLAVDDAGARAQTSEGLDDQREATAKKWSPHGFSAPGGFGFGFRTKPALTLP
jgi:hypothetical protein